MLIHVGSTNFAMSDALSEHAFKHINPTLGRFPGVTSCAITLEMEGKKSKAHATVLYSGASIHVATEKDDMYHAVKDVVVKVDRALQKHQGKHASARKRQSRGVAGLSVEKIDDTDNTELN